MNSLVPSSGSTSQKGSPSTVGYLPGRHGFLGDDRPCIAHLAAQCREDQFLGALVGDGDRRGVVLAFHREVAAIDVEDRSACAQRDVADSLDHLGRDLQAHRLFSYSGGDGFAAGGREDADPAADRADWIACQIFSGVSGMSTAVTPSGARASSTALTTAGQAPMVPASPAPLIPIGLVAQGTQLVRKSMNGTSAARGRP